MSEHERDELQLAAFRYAAGDMAPDESARFEEQLATDQAARDAVCQAVQLTEKLMLAAPDALPGAISRRTPLPRAVQAIAWMAIGAAAASLLFLLTNVFHNSGPDGEDRVASNTQRTEDDSQLIDPHLIDLLAWMEVQQATHWDTQLALSPMTSTTIEPFSDFASPTQIPDWMLQTNGAIE